MYWSFPSAFFGWRVKLHHRSFNLSYCVIYPKLLKWRFGSLNLLRVPLKVQISLCHSLAWHLTCRGHDSGDNSFIVRIRDPNAIMAHFIPAKPALTFPSFLNISGKWCGVLWAHYYVSSTFFPIIGAFRFAYCISHSPFSRSWSLMGKLHISVSVTIHFVCPIYQLSTLKEFSTHQM